MYLLHFAKMIRERRGKPATKPKPAAVKRVKVPVAAKPAAPTFRRRFGSELPFVEEREWRIVYHPEVKHFVKGSGAPEYYLPYVPGDELFTLVLPDNNRQQAPSDHVVHEEAVYTSSRVSRIKGPRRSACDGSCALEFENVLKS